MNRAKNIVNSRDRHHYLYSSKFRDNKQKDKSPILVTTCSTKFGDITKIINRYLPILYQDPVLDDFLRNRVKFAARRAKSLGSILSPSVLRPDERNTWLSCKGFYKCNQSRCGLCKYVKQTKTFSSSTNFEVHSIGSFISCSSTHKMNLITCTQCNIQYIECTIRKQKKRRGEHIQGIQIMPDGLRNLSSVSNFWDLHDVGTTALQVISIEKVIRPRRGGDWQRCVLMREA